MVMKMKYIRWFLPLILIGCVSELEIDFGDNSYILISGVLTNSFEERTIYVSKRESLNEEFTRFRAKASLYKNGAFELDFEEFVIGELQLPFSFKFEEGNNYHVEVTTADNQTFLTIPQFIYPMLRTDSMNYQIVNNIEVDPSGISHTKRLVEVYAHITIPENEKRYFRWQVDESWALKEVPDPDNNFDEIKTCYLYKKVTDNPSTILKPKDVLTGSVAIKVASRFLDESFLERHYFNAYLHTIDRKNYEFYEKAERLSKNSGTLFDEIPAQLEGNVYKEGDGESNILGHIEISRVDTNRLAISRDEIPVLIANRCEGDGPCPILEDDGFVTQKTICYCHDCDKVFGITALNKPWYWKD